MKITFLGGADEVGASCTLIEVANKRLLIDAGIRISPKSSRDIQASQLPDLQRISEVGGIDFILVTHAHTDHTGALPLVVSQYPNVPVLMTQPTHALVTVLQKDAQTIMKNNFESEGELPLFDEVAVDALMQAVRIVPFNQTIKLGEGLQVTYYISGHIIGAALLVIESVEGTLVMSGDVSTSPQRTVPSIKLPRIKADALVLESTYGGKLHANRTAEEKRLVQSLAHVIGRGGSVLIPAFALGRAQEVLQILLAYRDEIPAPVYVDGMVRSVCDAYMRFTEFIPYQTLKRAKGEHLFFRNNIHPITSMQHRSNVAMSHEPKIIVASSGMLTGGASQYYARFIAPDDRNAIFLTGYQDEESPGRFLQNLRIQRDNGEIPAVFFGKTEVKIRCKIETYSLSAHSDEQELVNIANALGAKEVMLVHGDGGARHSLASALRKREINVHTPEIGTTREFLFTRLSWAIKSASYAVGDGEPLDAQKLWERMKEQGGNYFSDSELAMIWWGNKERAAEVSAYLRGVDNVYFTPDWRNQTTFLVHTVEQVEQAERQRHIMREHPHIVGKLVVLRGENQAPQVGFVKSADVASFHAIVDNTRTSRYYGDALLWVVGEVNPEWLQPIKEGQEGITLRKRLGMVEREAQSLLRAWVPTFLPAEKRAELIRLEAPIHPQTLLPETIPSDIDPQLALIAVVMTLARDGAVLTEGGLLPQRLEQFEPMEMNEARKTALALFTDDTGLRKVGLETAIRRMTLHFEYPYQAKRLYADKLIELAELTGWEVKVRENISQEALISALRKVLPMSSHLMKSPSFYTALKEVYIEVDSLPNVADVVDAYFELTEYTLVVRALDTAPTGTVSPMVTKPNKIAPATESDKTQPLTTSDGKLIPVSPSSGNIPVGEAQLGYPQELNKVYAMLKKRFEERGLLKAGNKNGVIVVTFVSPAVGLRYVDELRQIQSEIGYRIEINRMTNQQYIQRYVEEVAERLQWRVLKTPGVFLDKQEVTLAVGGGVSQQDHRQAQEMVMERTGFTLVLIYG
jgi:Cft2 family RNA processing exonuclease